ncbi:MAG: hypothetical protein LBH43_05465 [Treponema sp.]|jgi:hypothetical protein|nr:hypothetical protein [Treponema sp.]
MCKVTIGKNLLFSLIAVLILVSCAGSPPVKNDSSSKPQPPLWVTDIGTAYPNSEWLCAVEQDTDPKIAERTAISRLAQIFRVDLNSVTSASRQLAEAISNVQNKTYLVQVQSSSLSQELVATSVVSGLIGLQVESWKNPYDGQTYANARMNRRECSARYADMIRKNENVIQSLKEEADRYPATFEAYELLNLAHTVALVTDDYYSLLTVLDPSTISKRPSYGNAEAVKSLARIAGQSIIVTIKITGDIDGRIAKAYAECFNSRGFRTNTQGANPYLLQVSFFMEDVELANTNDNKFVRYVLNCSLMNKAGVEILSFSENRREGHRTVSEARQRTIRAAEESIGSSGFASNFDTFLVSLL